MNIQLTISLLASDRPDTLEKCLASLVPFFKELNCELIVVFTGKEQKTLELIQQYTAHIIPFTWCDDFSAARNAGLREAKGEWFLYIDDDEWFEDPSEIIRFFQTGEYQQYQSAFYVVRNYTDWSGKKYTDANVGRMCRLVPDTRFVNPIHENLSPFLEPNKVFRSYVHHYGYAEKESSANKAPKFNRNLPILLKSYKEHPDVQNCMQLVQEYQSVDDFDTAIEYCRQGLEFAEKEKRIHACEMWMQVRLPILLSYAGQPEEALKEGERLLLSPRILEVGQAHLHAVLAELCWELKEYKKGRKHVREYREKLRYLGNHPEKAERQSAATVTYESAKGRAVTTYMAGLLFASELGDAKQMKDILSWFPWEDEEKIALQYENFEKWKSNYEEQKEVILEGFSQLKTENSYVTLQKALYAENKSLTEKSEMYFKACAENCPEGFLCHLITLAVRNGFSLNPLLEQISFESWDACAKELAQCIEISDIPEFLQKLSNGAIDFPLCVGRMEQYFLERQLTIIPLKIDTPYLIELLQQYCNSVITEANMLYKEELLTNPDFYALPYRFKFACMVQKVLECLKNEDFRTCIPFLEKAVHTAPKMSQAMSKLGGYLEERIKELQTPVSEEFEMLGKQVKQMLYSLMENKQWEEAYGVVNQLSSLIPNDLEITKLKQEILRELSR